MFGYTFSPAYTAMHTKLFDFVSSLHVPAMLRGVHVDSSNNSLSFPRDSVNATIWNLLRNAKLHMEQALTLSRKRKKNPVEANSEDSEEGDN